jgi:hypothetical protein
MSSCAVKHLDHEETLSGPDPAIFIGRLSTDFDEGCVFTLLAGRQSALG